MRASELIDRLLESTDSPDLATAAPVEAGTPYMQIMDAVRGWLDQNGSKEPSRNDAIDAMQQSGVPTPEKYVRDFMSGWQSAYRDSNFDDESVSEVAPPGWEPTVKAMKKHPDITNPWSLAWYMKGKGYQSRK